MSTADLLRTIFYPGTAGGNARGTTTLSFEGIDPGWALLIAVGLGLGLWVVHARLLRGTSGRLRALIMGLRVGFAAGLLFLATRPVIVSTVVEQVRQKLIVLADASASMSIADVRTTDADRERARRFAGDTPTPTRLQLLQGLAGPAGDGFWDQLAARAELAFYRFGTDAAAVNGTDAPAFFDALSADATAPATALGESLRQTLDQNRGQPVAGVLVLTDGANNRGVAPTQVAAVARADGVPLYFYAVGVTQPRDVALAAVPPPRLAFLGDKVTVRARLTAHEFSGIRVPVTLSDAANPDAAPLAGAEATLSPDGATEVALSFVPAAAGELTLELAAAEQEGEASIANNRASVRLRVIDNRVKVFMIEQEPRWDWRYLLDFLQEDSRLTLRCVMLDGDPSLMALPHTPFLPDLPTDRAALYESDIILLGDVDPSRLGRERMELIREWVDSGGGGLVFLAGPNHNPRSYLGTPLETLLPVMPAGGPPAPSYDEPVQLQLTAAGARSPLLRLAENERDNIALWQKFGGVRWTAPVTRARPGASVLLVDPTRARASSAGPQPVLARQRFGRGEVMYFGFNETYRWRSGIGGERYRQIWSQVFQALALERLSGASKQVQLRVDRPSYELGERVVISGQLYQPDFKPLLADIVPAQTELHPIGAEANAPPLTQDVDLRPVPDEPGSYRAEFSPVLAGRYRFFTRLDRDAVVEFDVVEPQLEQSDAAMNLPLLEATAAAAGGRVFREDDLAELPALLEGRTSQVSSLKRLELAYSPVLLGWLLLCACCEWFVRRLNRLK